jgi:hypothetical protein
VLLLSKVKELSLAAQSTTSADGRSNSDEADASNAKRREFTRALLLFSHRNYMQSLQLVASADIETYSVVFEDCGSPHGMSDLLGMSTVVHGARHLSADRTAELTAQATDLWWPPSLSHTSAPAFPALCSFVAEDVPGASSPRV